MFRKMNGKVMGKAVASVLMTGVVLLAGSGIGVAVADTPATELNFDLPEKVGPYCINATPGAKSTELNFSWLTQNKSDNVEIKYAPVNGTEKVTELPTTAVSVKATQVKVLATQGISQQSSGLGTNVSGSEHPIVDGKEVETYRNGRTNGVAPAGLFTGEYQNKATLKDLTAGAKYAYQVSDGNGKWSGVYTIAAPSDSSIAFAAFGDPQIGAFDNGSGTKPSNETGGHKNMTDDEHGWGNMMNLVAKNKKLDFLLSLGDQVEDYATLLSDIQTKQGGQWNQYNSFFNPSNGGNLLQSFPLVAFSGNHDHQMGEYYGYHYNQPNKLTDPDIQGDVGGTQYGNDGDYWFTAGPVLFMVLNSNNYGTAEHDLFMADAVKKNPNSKWRVAVWHHSAYSESKSHAGNNSVEDPILTIRKTWPAMMERHGVDVVLQGHDHYYTRTAQLLGGNVIDAATGKPLSLAENESKKVKGTTVNSKVAYTVKDYPSEVTNPKGVVYFTLDSGSGSKYYDFGTKTDHTFSVVGWQGYVPTYSYVTFSNDKFSIQTYSTPDNKFESQKLIDSYSITKTGKGNNSSSKTGGNSSAPAGSSKTGGSSNADSNPHTGSDNGNVLFTLAGILLVGGVLSGASFLVLKKKNA